MFNNVVFGPTYLVEDKHNEKEIKNFMWENHRMMPLVLCRKTMFQAAVKSLENEHTNPKKLATMKYAIAFFGYTKIDKE